MSHACPEPEELLRLLDGEITVNRSSQLKSHVAVCHRCARELESQRRLLARLAAPIEGAPTPADAETLCHRLAARAGSGSRPARWRWWRWWRVPAAGLASAVAAAALFMAVPRRAGERGQFTPRGAPIDWVRKVGVELWALEAAPRKLMSGSQVSQDTTFVASYSNLDTAGANLLAFGIDARGEVHWLYPAFEDPATDPPSASLHPLQVQRALPDSVVLEGVPPGSLRLVWIISRTPLHVSNIEGLPAGERAMSALQTRFPGARIGELLLHVRAAPRASATAVP